MSKAAWSSVLVIRPLLEEPESLQVSRGSEI